MLLGFREHRDEFSIPARRDQQVADDEQGQQYGLVTVPGDESALHSPGPRIRIFA